MHLDAGSRCTCTSSRKATMTKPSHSRKDTTPWKRYANAVINTSACQFISSITPWRDIAWHFLEVGCKRSSKVPWYYWLLQAFIHSVQQSIDKQTRRPCMPDYNARNDWSAGKLRPGRKGEHHSLSSACKCKIPQKKAWAPPPNCTGSPIVCRWIGIQQLGSTWMTWGINKGCSMPGQHVKTSLTHGSYTFCIFWICLARMQTQEILGHILHETLQDNYWQKST